MGACGVSDPKYPPCVDCGEPDSGTCPAGRCRECGTWIVRPEYGGAVRDQHAPECSLRDAADYHARDDAELREVREVRERRNGKAL